MTRRKVSLVLLFLLVSFLATFKGLTENVSQSDSFVVLESLQTEDVSICGVHLKDLQSLILAINYTDRNYLYEFKDNYIPEHMWWNALVGLNEALALPFSREDLESLVRRLRSAPQLLDELRLFIDLEMVRSSRNAKDFLFFFTYVCEQELFFASADPFDIVIDRAIRSLNDPYSYYENPKMAVSRKSEKLAFSGVGAGVGIVLTRHENTGPLVILEVKKGSEAELAGLRISDEIYAINQKEVADLSTEEAVSLLRGPLDSEVEIEIIKWRYPEREREVLTLRRTYPLPRSTSYRQMDSGVFLLEISSFTSKDIVSEVRETLEEIADSCKSPTVIIDLRGNSGGLLIETLQTTSFFLAEERVVIHTKDKTGVVNRYLVRPAPDKPDVEVIAVLVNRRTASAAEIMATAMRDEGVVIIGETSLGKGVGQQNYTLPNGGIATIVQFWVLTPNAESFNKVGIVPDVFGFDLDLIFGSHNDVELTC